MGDKNRQRVILMKFKEAVMSIMPVTLLVVVLNFTPLVSLTAGESITFIVSALFLIAGMGLFNIGAEMSMSQMGEFIGVGLAKSRKMDLIIVICLFMGILVTIAEPSLQVLASQLEAVIKPLTLELAVAVGVAILLVIAVLKIIFKKDLASLLFLAYLILFAACCLVVLNGNEALVAMAFDSGGVATGPITVPFIMAVGLGFATSVGGKNVEENSFGVVSLCSAGAIIAVMLLVISAGGEVDYAVSDYALVSSFGEVLSGLGSVAQGVLKAMAFIFVFFLALDFFFLKIPKIKLRMIVLGIIITVVGLIIFLTAVNLGFMPVGYKLGVQLAETSKTALIIFGFILGAVAVMAEPAVHVLKNQVEEVTHGLVSKNTMMIGLCVSVAISLGLSMIRIVYHFNLLYYVVPGYLISMGLSIVVPKIYTGIAFDSGGVASGPLTSSFVLPFAIGACVCCGGEASVLVDAFGVVAMVAMTPLITIQTLGFSAIYKKRLSQKRAIKRIYSAEDAQIIHFR